MNKTLFYQYIYHPELLDDRSLNEIEGILEEYPYFQSGRLLHIKNLSNQGSISYDSELKKTAVWVTDRSRLFHLLDNRVLLPVDEYKGVDKSESDIEDNLTIDFSALTEVTSFDSGLGSPKKEELNDELTQLIMSGSAQASTFFNVDDNVNLEDFVNTFKKKDKKTSAEFNPAKVKEERRKKLIDNFIIDQPKIVQNEHSKVDKEAAAIKPIADEPEMITDTLAKIYINQEKYEKAILAYEKLSLKYPEKNIYFAGQIKKIKQLINNQ